MMNEVFEQAVSAYRKGKTADVIQFRVGGAWGVAFTLPRATRNAMEHVGDQYRALGATEMRYIRRARLRNRAGTLRDVAIETLLPGQQQHVFDLIAGETIPVPYLRDETLAALERRLGLEETSILVGTVRKEAV